MMLLMSASPLRDSHGDRVIGAVAAAIDITARKEAERRSDRAMLQMLDHAHVLEKMQKQLKNGIWKI